MAGGGEVGQGQQLSEGCTVAALPGESGDPRTVGLQLMIMHAGELTRGSTSAILILLRPQK